MATAGTARSASDGKRLQHWLQILRPLSCWVLLVLVMFAYRTHQHLSEQTHLDFSVTLQGQPLQFDASATLDGQPLANGDRVPLGRHRFAVSHPKGEKYSTNLFIWYGEHHLGTINLKRTTGTLLISANPPARLITIQGPEFSIKLADSAGITTNVPTDRYTVQASYAHWTGANDVTVLANGASAVSFAPPFGALQLTCNKAEASFRLQSEDGRISESGELPATFPELPQGMYILSAEHGGDRVDRHIGVKPRETNEFQFKFVYGAASLDTIPQGASVFSADGRNWGITPLTLQELRPGNWKFTLQHDEYEPVIAMLEITADQTIHFQTNLVNRHYTEALQNARSAFSARQYDSAAKFADDALKYKSDDTEAISIRRGATGFSHLVRAKSMGQSRDFSAGISELNAALLSIPDNTEALQLLVDYKQQQQELEDEQARRKAVQRKAEERKNRVAQVQVSLRNESQGHDKGEITTQKELRANKDAKVVGDAIDAALRDRQPNFQINRYNWLDTNRFVIEATQPIEDGSLQCVIVGGQIGKSETLLCFAVWGHLNSHSASLLGGLLTATVVTDADRTGARAAKFQETLKGAAGVLEMRIRQSVQ